MLDQNNLKPFSRHIEMYIEEYDSVSLKNYFLKNNCTIISKYLKFNRGFSVFIKNEKNQIFECTLFEGEKYNFSISFKYGKDEKDRLTREDIVKLGLDL